MADRIYLKTNQFSRYSLDHARSSASDASKRIPYNLSASYTMNGITKDLYSADLSAELNSIAKQIDEIERALYDQGLGLEIYADQIQDIDYNARTDFVTGLNRLQYRTSKFVSPATKAVSNSKIGKFVGGMGVWTFFSSASAKVGEFVEPGLNSAKDFLGLSDTFTLPDKYSVDVKGDTGDNLKDAYYTILDENRLSIKDNFEYTTHGTETTEELGDLLYDHYSVKTTYDTFTIYSKYKSSGHSISYDAGFTSIGTRKEIYTGSSESTLKIETIKEDFHASLKADPGKADFYASGGCELDAMALQLGTDDVNVKGKLGLGVSGMAGVHDGQFSVKGSVALGLGVEVNLTIDFKKIGKNIHDVLW